MVEENKEQEQRLSKTLQVEVSTHKTLMMMKVEGDYGSLDELILKLVESDKKLKDIEQREKEIAERKRAEQVALMQRIEQERQAEREKKLKERKNGRKK